MLAEEEQIVATRPELLIVRVDRTDPSKNVVRGFRAFALLLERHPELRGRVGMLALLDPSRQGLPAYSEYLVAIEREARASTSASGPTAGSRSTCGSATTSRRRWRRTSSSTCCS